VKAVNQNQNGANQAEHQVSPRFNTIAT